MKLVEPIVLPEVEGAIDLIYGEFGGGKTYYATTIILDYLRRGVPVYSSYPVKFDGVYEANEWYSIILGVLGLKRKYRVIKKDNFHFISWKEMMSEQFVERLGRLVECVVVVDEAYAARLFDSYRKTSLSVEARMAVYGTRHMDRRFIIVAQRPNSIHVSSRAMVNRFYQCTQPLRFLWYLFGLRLFAVTQYEELKDETVDTEKPVKTSILIGKRSVFNAYDSKYLRDGRQNENPSSLRIYDIPYMERTALLTRKWAQRRFSAAEPT